jgi:hypothetical protein
MLLPVTAPKPSALCLIDPNLVSPAHAGTVRAGSVPRGPAQSPVRGQVAGGMVRGHAWTQTVPGPAELAGRSEADQALLQTGQTPETGEAAGHRTALAATSGHDGTSGLGSPRPVSGWQQPPCRGGDFLRPAHVRANCVLQSSIETTSEVGGTAPAAGSRFMRVPPDCRNTDQTLRTQSRYAPNISAVAIRPSRCASTPTCCRGLSTASSRHYRVVTRMTGPDT